MGFFLGYSLAYEGASMKSFKVKKKGLLTIGDHSGRRFEDGLGLALSSPFLIPFSAGLYMHKKVQETIGYKRAL